MAWRGTRQGLERFLELVSGAPADVEETGGVFPEGTAPVDPPTLRIRVRSTGWVPEQDFVALLRDEIPAGLTFEVMVADRRLWPIEEVA
jgi:hypothetical protein